MKKKQKIKLNREQIAAAPIEVEAVDFDDTVVAAEAGELGLEKGLDASEIKKKSVFGAMSFFGTTLNLNIVALAANLLLMAFLSPSDFGVYGFVMQINAILVFFSDVGLASSLIQKKREPGRGDYETVFWTQQALSWFIFGLSLLVLATGWVESTVGPAGNWILLALAISFPLATLKTVSSIKLSRSMQFHKMVIPQIFEQVFYNGGLIIMAWRGAGAMAYAYAIVARGIIGVIVMYVIQPFWPRFNFHWDSFKSTIKFGIKFQLNDFLARIKDNLFYLVVGARMGAQEFGYISWAKNWSMYPYNLTVQNIMNITFPTFSRLQEHLDLLRRAIEKSLFFITLTIFPILAGMVTFIYPLTVVVPEYGKWQPAIFSFVMFTLAIAWSAISSPLTNTLNAIGQINKTLKLMIFWTVLTWAVAFPLMWWLGFNGVALSAFLISWTSFLPVIMVRRVVKFKLWDNIWRQLLAAAVMAGFALALQSFWLQDIYWLIGGAIASGAVYGLVLLLVGRRKVWGEVKSLRAKKKG